ncbi:hypothetical protein C0J52_08331 [Blattella germanica]|nr:hypothetical protein C0J52_08331 [Blattella germanica]
MSHGEQFRFEEIKGSKVDAFVRSHEKYYKGGLLRIWPPGCAMFTAYRENMERVRRLKVYPDDVWIVTYPKCGK